ncbi:hypothetical protein LEP1GSC052_1844 [Leptospira kmetyi serovar Malaysia str. Bejo-Iso9]|nr:hypothetical protein LEP1GSC052_1844 [Leptospira kmetyi serovar Malaysia str. Bejo-Iso9]
MLNEFDSSFQGERCISGQDGIGFETENVIGKIGNIQGRIRNS